MPWANRQNSERARNLRNNPTNAEKILWPHLSVRKLAGVRFNRQVQIGPYICDFASRSRRLVIELDGGQHASDQEADAERSRFLEQQGYNVIRFWNHEVFENLEGVVLAIEAALLALPQPLPPAGGEF